MCSLDDADPCDVYRSVMRRAAKTHKCYECANEIPVGTVHRYVTMLYDRRWDAMRICPHCVAAARWLELVCGGYLLGGLSEELGDHWDEDPLYRSHWLGRAILGLNRRWRGMKPLPDPDPILRLHGVIGSAS